MSAAPLPAVARSSWRDLARFGLFVLYCVEGGILLMLAPWTAAWEDLFFFRRWRLLHELGLHNVTRGVVSGIGASLFLLGVWELINAALGRNPPADAGSRR